MSRPHAYILAGGFSSRMGTDKARVIIGGAPLLVRVARALQDVARSVTVVGQSPNQYSDLGFRCLADVVAHQGPLGGLAVALRDQPDPEPILLAACDLFGLQPHWIEALCAAVTPRTSAVAFCGEGHPGWEPLLALYSPSLLPEVEARLARGAGAMWRLLEAVGAVALPKPPDWERLVVVNTPEDLRRCT